MDLGGIIVLIIIGFIIFSLCGWCCRSKYKGAVLSRPGDINAPYPVQQTVPMPHNVAQPTAYPVQAYHPAYQPVRFAPAPDVYIQPSNVTVSTGPIPPQPGVVYPPPTVAPYPPAAPYPTGGAPYPTGGAPYPTGGAPYPTGGAPYPTGGAPYPTGGPPYPTTMPHTQSAAPYPPVPAVPVGTAPTSDSTVQPKLPSYQEAISAAPPPTNELYSKQAPYNPNYN